MTTKPHNHLVHSKDVPFLVPLPAEPKRLPVAFYRTARGSEPVREWLKNDVTAGDRYTIGVDIKKVEFLWPIGLPTCRPLSGGLWEVRSTLHGRIARVIFCIHEGKMILLHGFIKKTQKTPHEDIELALARKKELEVWDEPNRE